MRCSALFIALALTACVAQTPAVSPFDQQVADIQTRQKAESDQLTQDIKKQNADRESARAASRQAFKDLVAHYDEPGPECKRYLALSIENRSERVNKIRATFNRIYGSVHSRDQNRIATATVAYGGIVGLGAAMNARDEEQNLYLSLGEQLDQIESD